MIYQLLLCEGSASLNIVHVNSTLFEFVFMIDIEVTISTEHWLFRQCHKIRRLDCYVMDKGYDSDAVHRLIREDIYANSIIISFIRDEMDIRFIPVVITTFILFKYIYQAAIFFLKTQSVQIVKNRSIFRRCRHGRF
jgi:hypothetical protein